jgi:hypothetical protein
MDIHQERMEAAIHSLRAGEKRRGPAKKWWRQVWNARSQPPKIWNPKWSIGRLLRKKPQWNLHWRSGIGASF